MVVIVASVIALICGAIEHCFFIKTKKKKDIASVLVRHLLIDDLLAFAILKYLLHYEHFLLSYEYNAVGYLKVILATAIAGVVVMLTSIFARRHNEIDTSEIKHKKLWVMLKVVTIILFVFGLFCGFGAQFVNGVWSSVQIDQLLVNMFSPTEGTEASVYYAAFEGAVFKAVLLTVLFSYFTFSTFSIVLRFKKAKITFNDYAKKIIAIIVAIATLSIGVVYANRSLPFADLYKTYCVKSDFIEDNFVDTSTVKIDAPEQKRNLIFFYLESVENTYLSKELGGFMDENLMPELTELASEGYVFSDNSGKFGGPQQITGMEWSLASMVNQSMGIPLKVPQSYNAYCNGEDYIAGATALGDILKEQGYNQTVMVGAKAGFGGLDVFYQSHGDYKVFDYHYAIDNGLLPPDYYVFWGYEDRVLYEFAKEEITRLYQEGKPFNFTFENADTHSPEGYLSEDSPTPYADHYSNAIAYSTSQVVEFVRWVQQQPFYENTTIVMIGDHLSMAPHYFDNMGDYHRTQFNLILNPSPELEISGDSCFRNRQYSNIDMFPTILASLGNHIEGDRLALGVNLFSGQKTLLEQYGVETVNEEFKYQSEYYNKYLLKE